MSRIKIKNSYVDLLEFLCVALINHSEHSCYFTMIDLDMAQVYCSTCKKEVAAGSRGLIEPVWLEFANLAHSSQ